MLKAHGPYTALVSWCAPVNSPNLSFSPTLSAANTPVSLAIISSSLLWVFAASLHAPSSKTSTSPSHRRNHKTRKQLDPPSSEQSASSINAWLAAPDRWSAGRLHPDQTTITTPPPAAKSQLGADNHYGRLGTSPKWKDTGFTGCGKTHDRVGHRGRAALQGRVTLLKSTWGLAPEVVLPWQIRFFRSRFRTALSGYNIWCFSLDRHNRREYFKHPRVFQSSFFKEATTERIRGDSKLL
jgi:hypothetical protein